MRGVDGSFGRFVRRLIFGLSWPALAFCLWVAPPCPEPTVTHSLVCWPGMYAVALSLSALLVLALGMLFCMAMDVATELSELFE